MRMLGVLNLCVLLAMLFFSACSGGRKVSRTSAARSNRDMGNMKEDFNPVDLDDDDIEIPDSDDAEGNSGRGGDILADTPSDTVGTGYRIQIIQTTDPEEAKEVQKDAILRFDQEVYRAFDPPFYKVRVGDFVNWNDAEKIQKLAIQKGFRDAWVIRTKINLRKAYSAAEQW